MRTASRPRLLAALFMLGAAPFSQAGQSTGQLDIRMTISEACQVSAEPGANRLAMSSSHCTDRARYRVMYPASGKTVDQPDSLRSVEHGNSPSPTLVTVYW